MSRKEPHPAPLCRSSALPQLNGIFVLNKPSGPSSAQCLNLFKKLGQKKIGHAGTLDPLADGVLIALLGQATKVSAWLLQGGGKTYSGVIRLGMETDTWDCLGKIISEQPCSHISAEMLEREIQAWHGSGEQQVPPYSAAKHNGQPLYKLARKGKDTPVKTKTIHIAKAQLLHIGLPFIFFRVICSSGSYIRSLAHSLGKRLGCGAVLWRLTREYSHPFGLDDACALADLRHDPGMLACRLRPIAHALPDWPLIRLDGQGIDHVRNGRAVPLAHGEDAEHPNAILCAGEDNPLALARLSDAGDSWIIIRGLWN